MGTAQAGGGKWGIVALRFGILATLLLFLALSLRTDELGALQTIARFDVSFWILFGVYLALNVAYAFEAVEAFVSQRIAAGIFVIDVVLVCTLAYRAMSGLSADLSIEFFLAYFLTILVAATSTSLAIALGGALVSTTVYALMVAQSAGSFENLIRGPLEVFAILLLATAFLVSLLASGTRRQLGQRQGVQRAMSVSSRLAGLFDLGRAGDIVARGQLLEEFARGVGDEIFIANDCRVFLRSDASDAATLISPSGGETPPLAMAAPTESAQLLCGATAELTEAGLRSVITAPVSYHGSTFGLLWVARSDPALPDLSPDDRELAQSLATHVGIALHNAEMLAEVQEARQTSDDALQQLQDTQDRLLRTEKLSAVGEIVSRVAHELNTPLTNILGTVELLEEQSPTGAMKSGLATVHKTAIRCRALVSSLVKAIGRQRGNRVPADLNRLAMEVVEGKRDDLTDAAIALEFELSPDLPQVLVDREQVARVVAHVVDNSVQAMLRNNDSERRLVVRSRSSESEVLLSVSDTGPGINLDYLVHVFQPFFTGDDPDAASPRQGLGLSVAYQVMRDHGGSLSATTDGDGGTTITLRLPRPHREEKGRRMTEMRKIARLLLIDPDPAMHKLVESALVGQARVFAVATAEEAFALLEAQADDGQSMDAAMADLALRGASAAELREGLIERCNRLRGRIAWTSSSSVPEAAEEVITKSGGVFLAKPFTLAEMRAAVGGILERDLELAALIDEAGAGEAED